MITTGTRTEGILFDCCMVEHSLEHILHYSIDCSYFLTTVALCGIVLAGQRVRTCTEIWRKGELTGTVSCML